MKYTRFPKKQGLYDPAYEHDACGVGFVCDIAGSKSHTIIRQGLEVLRRLSHRGATGADPLTGDGAGIMIQMPHTFFAAASQESKITLPAVGSYGTGLVFLPRDLTERQFCKDVFSSIVGLQGQVILGWRQVPVDDSKIGVSARSTMPHITQVFIGSTLKDNLDFERRLFVIRKLVENAVRSVQIKQKANFHITNLSSRTFCFKGQLKPEQLEDFFLDLSDKKLSSALCLVHSRYSTNTFPTWDLAQPFRFLAHNGEINTLRGNINWMRAREGLLESKLFGKDFKNILPVIVPGGSDSAAIDNLFELLVLSGRPLAQAMMMLIPCAWQQDNFMDEKIKDFYRYQACLMEPWDGPAAIAFTDGTKIGAVLDRNGLRPARYLITKKGLAVMASEAGVLDIAPEEIKVSGRLEPGKMFFIDTQQGEIIDDAQIKKEISCLCDYSGWLKENMLEIDGSRPRSQECREQALHYAPEEIAILLKTFGYTREDLKFILKPMAENAQEPVGSMGNDTPLALLSKKPQLLYSYFKQLFAQVTNPAIDPIREELVMSLESYLGAEINLLEESALHCARLRLEKPILSEAMFLKLHRIKEKGFRSKAISILFEVDDPNGFISSLERICAEAKAAIEKGYTFIILSDKGVNVKFAALPSLLATAGLHHYLLRCAIRTQVSIILETAEAREVHHFALLFGYGADCVYPYLAYEAVRSLAREKQISFDEQIAVEHYMKALEKGILKILSKMGISTLQSYRGAQIFEALGVSDEVIGRCFEGTASRIGGANFADIAQETVDRHKEAFCVTSASGPLATGGVYQWKKDGEFHLWNPESIASLQDAARNNDFESYKKFAQLINDQSCNPTTLRSLLKFKKAPAVPIDEVEPEESIVKRFVTGAMSFGSLSRAAHETIAIAMNRMHARSNSGEGGEDPARFHPLGNGDSARSSTKQVASGRFGVTTNYLVNADELQIKIAQGAKPGEGGQLPGHKVSVTIAKTRYTTPGVTLISPPPHHDIYSIEDLAELIFDLKNVNPHARVSVKLVSEVGVGTIAAGVAKGHADMILISGGDGGTGASPLSSIRNAGLPWELGLSETHQTLVLNGLRSRVRLQADGQIRTGRDIAIAAILGAEEFGFATAALIVLGCVMLRHCNLNNCSVGIATQDEMLVRRFQGRPEYLINYFHFVAEELRQIMAGLGLRTVNELIGRTDLLELNSSIPLSKAGQIDFSKILYKPQVLGTNGRYCTAKQAHGVDKVLDLQLIDLAKNAIDKAEAVKINLPISNIDRASGAMLSGRICQRYGEEGLVDDTIHCKFIGTAGQSFAAWLARGVTFELEGMANDYVGKGISGGSVVIYPDRRADFEAGKNIIIGNTAFYGAISGEAYISGVAGERFCIRNSGLLAVVEGVGDHGCEYMTGGKVVVLGITGRNFAAGMSGGVAYVYDTDKKFNLRCNLGMVELESISVDDAKYIYRALHDHYRYTHSEVALKIMDNFERDARKFIKVMPLEYKRILESKAQEEQMELTEVSDG